MASQFHKVAELEISEQKTDPGLNIAGVSSPLIYNVSTPVVVLKLEHYGSLGIIRSLGKLGIPVYGVDNRNQPPAAVSRYCRKYFNWDIDNSYDEETLGFLLKLNKYLSKPALLIATSDEIALFLSRNSEELKKYFLLPNISSGVVQKLCDKKELNSLALKYNMPVPETYVPESLSDVIDYADIAKYPVMLKGINGGKLENKTGKKMVIVYNNTQLINLYKRMENDNEKNLMIQEYIPNTKNHMWIFNGYFDASSKCLAAFTGRKLRQNPVFTGMTSLGVCQWNDTLASLTKRFLNNINYSGPVDVDFVYDVRDQEYKLLDVNPRIGASFRLFVGLNGMDIARAFYLDSTNQPISFSSALDGRRWFVEDKDILSSFLYGKYGHIRIREWLKSFKGVEEAGYFDMNDLLPFVNMFWYHIKKSSLKLFKKISSSILQYRGPNNKFPEARQLYNKEIDIKYFDQGKQAECQTESSMSFKIPSESDQNLCVKKYFDQNENWLGAIYETSGDPHALGVRRRKEYIINMLDKSLTLKHGYAVDIGCGPGAYIYEIEKRGFKVFGIDLSTEMLKHCAKNLNMRNDSVKLLCADSSNLPFSGELFNLVLSIGVLQYVVSIEKAIQELNRITAEYGFVVICFENIISFSNLGFYVRNSLSKMLSNNKANNAANKNSEKSLLSNWFLNNVKVPHRYKLYNPYWFEKIMQDNNFKKVNSITYGYPFKALRKMKIIPKQVISYFEKSIEQFLHKTRIPVLSYSGEFYIGLFQKANNSNSL